MPATRRRKVVKSSPAEAVTSLSEMKRKRQEPTPEHPIINHEDDKTLLFDTYSLSFPKDFFDLWDFCAQINPSNPRHALLHTLKFELVGPYEVLSKEIEVRDNGKVQIHLHWRFYYDPPEFMTTILSRDVQEPTYHVGYWRDDPTDENCVIARTGGDNWSISILSDNIFYEIEHRLQCRLTTARGKDTKAKLQQLKDSLYAFTEHRGINMNSDTLVKKRNKLIVAPGLHGAGLVVPIDDQEVGYRPVEETRAKLLKMFKSIDQAPNDDVRMVAFDPVQELITYVQLANDECDFGMGLELGIDMFCYGSKYLNKAASRMLSMAYSLLKRDLYKKIIECHLADRRKDHFERFPM